MEGQHEHGTTSYNVKMGTVRDIPDKAALVTVLNSGIKNNFKQLEQ
jgi:hypothetical protein